MDSYDKLLEMEVYGSDEEKIGTVDALYVTQGSDDPSFVTVNTGWFSSSSFIPLAEADIQDDKIIVPFTKDKVKDAPNVEADEELSSEEEDRLYSYYNLSGNSSTSDDYDENDTDTVGTDTSGPTTDDAMTRSEEELHVGTRKEETGRYRLRKYVVTENVTKTVPVQREEVSLEREPITDDNVDSAMAGPAISDEEHEVVTHAEVPVVEKNAVPKERIRVNKDLVEDEETINEEVRKEQVDLDDDVRRS